jgi:hypothetical protein
MSTTLDVAAPLLTGQHALVTAAQLKAEGVHGQAVKRLVDRGLWERLDHSLYGPVGVPMTWRRRLMAAALIGPPGTVVSHRALAALHGVGSLDDPLPEVSIPAGTSLRRPWLIAHESTDLHLAEPEVLDGIPVTSRCRLAIDLGAVVSFERYKHAVRELRHGHGLTNDQLLRAYLRHSERGRNGCGAIRDWLDRYYDLVGVSESGLELVVLDAIIDASLPAPGRQLWVAAGGARYRLDLAYADLRLAIEVDGAQHDDVDLRASDAVRTARLEAAGWRVVRIRSSHFATDLAAALLAIRSPVVAAHHV